MFYQAQIGLIKQNICWIGGRLATAGDSALAFPIEVTAVNGSYYGEILSRSFPFLFFSSRQLKKF